MWRQNHERMDDRSMVAVVEHCCSKLCKEFASSSSSLMEWRGVVQSVISLAAKLLIPEKTKALVMLAEYVCRLTFGELIVDPLGFLENGSVVMLGIMVAFNEVEEKFGIPKTMFQALRSAVLTQFCLAHYSKDKIEAATEFISSRRQDMLCLRQIHAEVVEAVIQGGMVSETFRQENSYSRLLELSRDAVKDLLARDGYSVDPTFDKKVLEFTSRVPASLLWKNYSPRPSLSEDQDSDCDASIDEGRCNSQDDTRDECSSRSSSYRASGYFPVDSGLSSMFPYAPVSPELVAPSPTTPTRSAMMRILQRSMHQKNHTSVVKGSPEEASCRGEDSPSSQQSTLSLAWSSDESSPQASTVSKSKQRRMPWTNREEELLVLGVQNFGVGHWAEIKAFYNLSRSAMQLKDKWRNLARRNMADLSSPQC